MQRDSHPIRPWKSYRRGKMQGAPTTTTTTTTTMLIPKIPCPPLTHSPAQSRSSVSLALYSPTPLICLRSQIGCRPRQMIIKCERHDASFSAAAAFIIEINLGRVSPKILGVCLPKHYFEMLKIATQWLSCCSWVLFLLRATLNQAWSVISSTIPLPSPPQISNSILLESEDELNCHSTYTF